MLRHITISIENYEKLRNMGKTSDSFNDVLNDIFKKLEDEGGKKDVPT